MAAKIMDEDDLVYLQTINKNIYENRWKHCPGKKEAVDIAREERVLIYDAKHGAKAYAEC